MAGANHAPHGGRPERAHASATGRSAPREAVVEERAKAMVGDQAVVSCCCTRCVVWIIFASLVA